MNFCAIVNVNFAKFSFEAGLTVTSIIKKQVNTDPFFTLMFITFIDFVLTKLAFVPFFAITTKKSIS